jgi:ribosomal protein S18 acetylase RimI-like enzyme
MRIEKARPSEAIRLTRIAYAAKRTWGYPEAWIVAWESALTLTGEFIRSHPTFCARVGPATAGFCSIGFHDGWAEIQHMWVAPSFAGHGIGRALFCRCEAEARKAGAKRLSVESDPHAEGFYRKLGACPVARRPAPMEAVDRSLVLLEKSIG